MTNATAPARIFFSNEDYEIRPATSCREFKPLWWRFMLELGWDRGYDDLETYMEPSRGSGMILLIDRASREPVGHVAAVINDNKTGWIALFVIGKDHRGKGMGAKLFQAALEDAKDHGVESLGLDGVAEQRQTYGRRGFVESPLGVVSVMFRSLSQPPPPPSSTEGLHLVDIRHVPTELLVQHELKYTGFERSRLWSQEHLFHRSDVLGFALVSKPAPQTVDDLLAWTIVRRCPGGARIGPLYARDSGCARHVLVESFRSVTPEWIQEHHVPDTPLSDLSADEIASKATIVVEAWSGQPDSLGVFESLGFKTALNFHRMWVGSKAPVEQLEGGLAQEGMFAIFDAATG